MTIFDKTLINLHKGYERLKDIAAVFSERVKAELNIVRTRIRIDSVQDSINELHRVIGSRVVDLKIKAALSKPEEQLLNEEEIVAAFAEIAQRKKEIEELKAEIRREQESFSSTPNTEDTSV